MAVLTIRQVDDELHRALRLAAAENGRSVEAEVRAILEEHLAPPRMNPLIELPHAVYDVLYEPDNDEIPLPDRKSALVRPPVDFS